MQSFKEVSETGLKVLEVVMQSFKEVSETGMEVSVFGG